MRRRPKFRNAYPHGPHTLLGVLRWKLGLGERRTQPLLREVACIPIERPAPLRKEEVRVTWIGHSTFLLQHRGRNILTDPIFGNCGPLGFGPLRRLTPPGIKAKDLPEIHDVLISHSHYDHLDLPSIRSLGAGPRYWLPAGLSGWFRKRNFTRLQELDWWQSAPLFPDITVHSVPAQHAAGRNALDRDRTHWCGWVVRSSERSIYFAGDTGYSLSFREIGERFNGLDLALLPIGAYEPRWLMAPVHMNPAEAVQAHLDLKSKLSVACHWGTFRLTDEPLIEPPALLQSELLARQINRDEFRILPIGGTVTI